MFGLRVRCVLFVDFCFVLVVGDAVFFSILSDIVGVSLLSSESTLVLPILD